MLPWGGRNWQLIFPHKNLAQFFEKTTTNVNKMLELIPGIGTAILGVLEPHCETRGCIFSRVRPFYE
jgi:hypothetical protein